MKSIKMLGKKLNEIFESEIRVGEYITESFNINELYTLYSDGSIVNKDGVTILHDMFKWEEIIDYEEAFKIFNKEFITADEMETLESNNFVETIENLGYSGVNIGYIWYVVSLKNGNDFDVYL